MSHSREASAGDVSTTPATCPVRSQVHWAKPRDELPPKPQLRNHRARRTLTPSLSLRVAPFAAPAEHLSGLDFNVRGSWYYKDNAGNERGPSVLDTLVIMWDFGELTERTPVWTEGMSQWAVLRDVPPLFKALAMGLPDAHAPDAPDTNEASVYSGTYHTPALRNGQRSATAARCDTTPPQTSATAYPPTPLTPPTQSTPPVDPPTATHPQPRQPPSRAPSAAATPACAPSSSPLHRADGSPSWAELDAKWEQLTLRTQALNPSGDKGRWLSTPSTAACLPHTPKTSVTDRLVRSPLPSDSRTDTATGARGWGLGARQSSSDLDDDKRSSEHSSFRLRYPSGDGGATMAGRPILAADGAAVESVTGALQQLLQEQLSSLESGFDERRRELQADYDRCHAELADKLKVSQQQCLREEAKRRALQEEREAARRERAEAAAERADLEASRDELAARGNALESELEAIRLQLLDERRVLEVGHGPVSNIPSRTHAAKRSTKSRR